MTGLCVQAGAINTGDVARMLALRQPQRLGWADVREAKRMDSGCNSKPRDGSGRSSGAWKAGDAQWTRDIA